MRQSRCRSCGAFIVWARIEASSSTKGTRSRWHPFDADPVELGTHVLATWDDPPVAIPVGAGELAFDLSRERFVSHLSTCASRDPRSPRRPVFV